ncbi:unnamed protein product [Effrenium voratum]|nr:unnamed protein product [Effrenium voratum]
MQDSDVQLASTDRHPPRRLAAAPVLRCGQGRQLCRGPAHAGGEKPDLVNCQPNGRWSALHHAAHKGNLAAVQSLLERGASLTLKTREGLTPVEVASSSIFDHLLYLSLQASEAEEAKGKCSKRCASEEVLRTLTLWRFSPSNLPAGVCLSEEDSQCLICLEDFKEEERAADPALLPLLPRAVC